MKETLNGKRETNKTSIEASKIDVIKELIFGDNISTYEQEFVTIKNDILDKKAQLNELINSTRKELDIAIDSLSTDLNIRITEVEDKLEAKADELSSKKLDKKVLGDLLIKLGTKISD